jgi:hypothetical protein
VTIADELDALLRHKAAPRGITISALSRAALDAYYRPGEICQFDVWQPRAAVPAGQTRQGWVVVACLRYSRADAGVLIFSKETEDLLAGIAGCLRASGRCRKSSSGIARPASTATLAARARRSAAS